MNEKSSIGLSGRVRFFLFRAGELVETSEGLVWNKNTVVDGGVTELLKLIFTASASGASTFGYIGIGTGTTTPTTSDTALETEYARSTISSASSTTKKITVTATINITSTASISEAGIFNASSGGVMLSRAILTTVLNAQNGDTVTATWEISGSGT